ncbi:hypothetical protein RRG08_038569 [Elysia crispata]|uniref:Uncharacterized protein n=1 Tax=Elysia crispata TaxID=231223 RepID=A0AAE0YG58_9GAST|nr:hypothetical protein RRG08_038569 [Elysia crispata]
MRDRVTSIRSVKREFCCQDTVPLDREVSGRSRRAPGSSLLALAGEKVSTSLVRNTSALNLSPHPPGGGDLGGPLNTTEPRPGRGRFHKPRIRRGTCSSTRGIVHARRAAGCQGRVRPERQANIGGSQTSSETRATEEATGKPYHSPAKLYLTHHSNILLLRTQVPSQKPNFQRCSGILTQENDIHAIPPSPCPYRPGARLLAPVTAHPEPQVNKIRADQRPGTETNMVAGHDLGDACLPACLPACLERLDTWILDTSLDACTAYSSGS